MKDTSRSQIILTKLQEIAEQAKEYPETVFTTLVHHIDVDWLREAYKQTNKSSAAGIDGVTGKEYEAKLEENLEKLHKRMKEGKYKAPPVVRVWIEEGEKKRPIGNPTFEDKIVQRAVVMILEAIYEQDFYDFSHGYRKGHSPHQALKQVWEKSGEIKVNWIIDADVSGFFDAIPHAQLREILKQRVNDGGILRLIGKWLNAGVMEEEVLTYAKTGSPQGGVISPMLANIYLHTVLDEWYEKVVKPRLKGRSYLIRFADDFIIGCELESDAKRVREVLPKRLESYGLSINRQKTKMVKFGKPPKKGKQEPKNGTFDFLGFTHYWGKSRLDYWIIKRKTIQKKKQRSIKGLRQRCKENRHLPLEEQYQKLSQKLRGHYQYYGIINNYRQMEAVYYQTVKNWKYWLNRRSKERDMIWEKYEKILKDFFLPKPRIIHKL